MSSWSAADTDIPGLSRAIPLKSLSPLLLRCIAGSNPYDAALYAERYNLLNAFFASIPGNRQFNLRRLAISDANYADLAFLFTVQEGEPTNRHLKREFGRSTPAKNITKMCAEGAPKGTSKDFRVIIGLSE